MTREKICKKRHIAFDLNMCNYMMERKKERKNMKRFKTLICICLILIVVSSMAIVIGRYAISKNVTESSSEMQLAESKKNAEEIKYGTSNTISAEFNTDYTTYGTLIIKKSSSSYGITRLDGYEFKVNHLIIDGASGDITEGAFKD